MPARSTGSEAAPPRAAAPTGLRALAELLATLASSPAPDSAPGQPGVTVWEALAAVVPRRYRGWHELLQAAASLELAIFPWPASDQLAQRLGRRLILTSRRRMTSAACGLFSSHLGAAPDQNRRWFAALRAVLEAEPEVLVAHNTTCAPWVTRWAEQTGRTAYMLRVEEAGTSGVEWLRAALARQRTSHDSLLTELTLSPAFTSAGPLPLTRGGRELADAFLLAFVERGYLLKLRPRGRLAPLIQESLEQPGGPRLRLVVGSELVEPVLAERLMAAGAEGWWACAAEPPRRVWRHRGEQPVKLRPVGESEEPYLIHCTRRRNGPWPGETWDEYRDELLWDRPGADHSELAALLRILAQRKLTGSTEGIRGRQPVICFAELRLPSLAEMRIYRRHRRRWDFGPFGIAVRRDWLRERGAQPVDYGDERLWETLPDDRRHLFQPVASRRGDDWRAEREWRLPGSLDLRQVPAHAAFVFVPDDASARWVSFLSAWPVVICPQPT